jgi:homoserine dehydrogenase
MDGEVTFVDLTSGKTDMLDFHKQVITQSNNALVTANKNPISLYSMEDFNMLLKKYGRYNANTTVMGGSGAFDFVNERAEMIDDKIHLIKGCFSGTLGYVLSEVEKGKKFSQVVRAAKEAGYTEPNPWDDLNGLDVGRKILILARLSGNEIAFEDLKIEPLIDEKYAQYT